MRAVLVAFGVCRGAGAFRLWRAQSVGSARQVEERHGCSARRATVTADTQIAAYSPPAEPQIARAQPDRAVAVLLRRAEDQQRSGDLDAATVSLERALRITPDDALLWQRLAGNADGAAAS